VHEALPNDTDPRAEAVLIAGLRAMSAAQKAELVGSLISAVQELALIDVRRRHPSAGPREQALRVASRWLDAESMRRAFGWDIEREGY